MVKLIGADRSPGSRALSIAACALGVVAPLAAAVAADSPVRWSANSAPSETMVTGGGWTLEQSGAAVGLKSAGYCDANGNQVGNPGTERMQPYYFPTIVGQVSEAMASCWVRRTPGAAGSTTSSRISRVAVSRASTSSRSTEAA